MKKRIAVIALATAALLATSVAATAKPAGNKLSGTLKVVAWEGYTENQWVAPFEKQTGCKVQHQYAGSSDASCSKNRGRIGRGPTRLMSLRRTFQSCGSSSS